jgi:hypothetical protein
MPMMAQDYLKICFKDGTSQTFFLRAIKNIVVSNIDENGFEQSGYQYQHITTPFKDFVFDIADIDCITFTKYYEETAKKNLEDAALAIFPALSDCETIEDAQEQIDAIKNSEGVEDAWSDGHCLYVKIKDGETETFHFNHDANDEDEYDAKSVSQIRRMVSYLNAATRIDGKKLKFAIVNQQHNDKNRDKYKNKYFTPLESELLSLGVDAKYYPELTIDFLYNHSDNENSLHLYDYDAVFLVTHGNYDKEAGIHNLLLSKELYREIKTGKNHSKEGDYIASQQLDVFRKQALNGRLDGNKYLVKGWVDEKRGNDTYWVCYANLSESFFEDIVEDNFLNSNSVLFNVACQSLMGGESFAETLLHKRGLGWYLGYDESDSFGQKAGYKFFHSALSGCSYETAFYELPFYLRSELVGEGATLSGIWKDSWQRGLFLFPTVTKQIEQSTAQNAFNSFGYVEVEGNTTCIDPNADEAVKMGFQYSTNENFSSAMSVVSSDVIKLTKPLDNGNGNVQFRAKLTDLQPGNTYFYRAYTYDGLNYNYGETCSFEINDSSSDIVAYTSCPDSHHPHLIDLCLPSGTKWACCNVGASKPEDYGGYFAWGETKEKTSYTEENYLNGKGRSYDIGSDIAGTQYDAATANWGSPWVMPNKEQMDELVNSCTSEWTTQNGVNGRRFTGPNGASIFLPTAGYRRDDALNNAGSRSYYWSSSLSAYTYYAWNLTFLSGYVSTYYYQVYRYYGQSVRPVRKN